MKIKLYVDDLRKVPAGWHLARTVTEAIRVLDQMEVTEVSVDHDISHAIGLDAIARPFPCGETFEPVFRYLKMRSRLPDFTITKITIHTANGTAGTKMREILGNIPGVEIEIALGKPCNRYEDVE
jgi:hypothetical protein